MSTKPPAASGGGDGVQRLKPNAVGLVGVIFMTLATAAPITAMTSNMPIMAGIGTGTGAPAGFLIATAVLTIFSIGYIAMARRITAAGAFYGFISHGLGRIVGMGSGLLAVLAYVVFEATLVALFAVFGKETFEAQLGIDLPWQVYAFAMVALIALLAFFEISLTAKVLGAILVLEILILAAVALAVLVSGGGPDGIPAAPINPVEAFDGPSVGIGLFFAFWCWVGFESTAMYGEESRDPKRTIPIATMVVVVGVGLFYAFVSWMVMSGNGVAETIALSKGSDPFETVFAPVREFLGGWAVTSFRWLLLTGSFACGMAFHNCAARYLYAFGREGFIHPSLGRTHPRHGSPYVASFVQSGLVVAITIAFWISGMDPYAGQYSLMALLGTFSILIVQALCSFAVVAYFWRQPGKRRPWTTLVAPLVGGVAMIGVVLLLVTNMDTAAGTASSTLFFTLIPWIVAAVFLLGCAIALRLRQRSPERYRIIGHVTLADEATAAAADPRPAAEPVRVGAA
ncbi:APC family permease [Patulibacter defluvii]|uniref:APC family permease n=1 Tax=Patulibacter defluvii TaxID=3095358 RepID=UPI002A75D832|nr:APC family permease [Patulibacter sp. DM4]